MPYISDAKSPVERPVRSVDIRLERLSESDPDTIFNIVIMESDRDEINDK